MVWIDSLLPNTRPFRSAKQPVDLPELRDWSASFPNLEEAWRTCPRGDWRLWLARRTAASVDDVRRVVAAAAACARWILPFGLKDDERAARAVELAEKWAGGEGDEANLRLAADAALEATHQLDGNVHVAEVLVSAAAAAACRLADASIAEDPQALALAVDNAYPLSAYAWAKAHAAADTQLGRIPREDHYQLYERARIAAREEARQALDTIISRYLLP